MWSFFSYLLCLLSDAVLDKSSSLWPHGTPYGIKLMKCPAWVAATLSGSFNKGVIYRQHGGLTAFSDSHVSVWTEPRTGQRDRVNSVGSTGLKYTLWLIQFASLKLLFPSSEVSKWQLAAALHTHTHTAAVSRCFGKVLCTEMLFSVVVVCLCLLVFLSSGVSNYRHAGFCQSGEGCWWRGDLLAREGCKHLL